MASSDNPASRTREVATKPPGVMKATMAVAIVIVSGLGMHAGPTRATAHEAEDEAASPTRQIADAPTSSPQKESPRAKRQTLPVILVPGDVVPDLACDPCQAEASWGPLEVRAILRHRDPARWLTKLVVDTEVLDASGEVLHTKRTSPWLILKAKVRGGEALPFKEMIFGASDRSASVRIRVVDVGIEDAPPREPGYTDEAATVVYAPGARVDGQQLTVTVGVREQGTGPAKSGGVFRRSLIVVENTSANPIGELKLHLELRGPDGNPLDGLAAAPFSIVNLLYLPIAPGDSRMALIIATAPVADSSWAIVVDSIAAPE